MVKPIVNVVKTVNIGSFVGNVEALAKKQVLVGIRKEDSPRNDKINNAELLYIQSHGVRKAEMREEMQQHIDAGKKYSEAHSLYIQSHGSPLWHIPPRPVLEPAIEDRKTSIAKQFQKAAVASIDGNRVAMEAALEKAGQLGQDAAVTWFDNPKNGWPPNSPRTIAQKGSTSPLVDTAEMKKSISFVVRDRGEGE